MRRGETGMAPTGEAGMTLIEMLVVLAIIGVAAGAVTLGIGAATRGPSVETEARRLATRLQAAADDALIGDRVIAFTGDSRGYGFASFGENGLTAETGEAMGYHRLPGGIEMKLSAKPPVVLGAEGAARALTATLQSGDQRWRVVFDGLTATAIPAPAA